MAGMPVTLGQLQRLNPRKVWTNEATELTPWLAQEDNLQGLADAIGLDLELEAQEKNVGPFRADILCRDTSNGSWVLIENQLERTDHSHLGQLLTYAAGLEAVTIVWIAERFTEEHRAALDWLNSITEKDVNFFGIELEIWRIDNSPPAVRFNLASKPNQWARQVATAKAQADISPTKQLQLAYWTAFRNHLEDHGTSVKTHKPLPQHWANASIGRSGFRLSVLTNTQLNRVGVALEMHDDRSKDYFALLRQRRTEFEAAVGEPMIWSELPDKKTSRIELGIPVHSGH